MSPRRSNPRSLRRLTIAIGFAAIATGCGNGRSRWDSTAERRQTSSINESPSDSSATEDVSYIPTIAPDSRDVPTTPIVPSTPLVTIATTEPQPPPTEPPVTTPVTPPPSDPLPSDPPPCTEERVFPAGVLFDPDSDILRPSARSDIEGELVDLQDVGISHVTVFGHTDSRQSDEYNADLSARRANTVARVVAEILGLSSDLVTPVGRGETELVAPDTDASGRFDEAAGAQNRRVTIEIEYLQCPGG